MSSSLHPYSLPVRLSISSALRDRVARDYERFATAGFPSSFEAYLADEYQLDLATHYGGLRLKNPWGKASGQLSMTSRQVAEDVAAGLGFVVLKTVIAEDAGGGRSMEAWAVKEARMTAQRITGHAGREGWTISWKGRGWWLPFAAYLDLLREARQLARGSGTLIVPSCKYHLPTADETVWRTSEYDFTTARLLEAWRAGSADEAAMPLEKDFSPTLAGSNRAAQQAKILEWLQVVPGLVRSAAASAGGPPIPIGLKLFNALFDDEFQLEMLRTLHQAGGDRPDFYIYGNRLFDPNREFEGMRGIAYGGPDLSDRNLRVMRQFQDADRCGEVVRPLLDWSATGNICSGKMAVEYALRGASSFQLHTFFQLPSDQYRMVVGTKTQKALHELYFHPEDGFIVWLHEAAARLGLARQPLRFVDIIGGARQFDFGPY